MNETAHLTEEQFTRYDDRSAAADELLALDDHIAGCAFCRDRLYARRHASSRIRTLRADFTGHLDYAAVSACSEGRATAQQRQHLQECAMCQGEVLDLSRFRTELHDTPRAPLEMPGRPWKRRIVPVGIAAILLLGGTGMFMLGRRPPAPPPVVSQKPVEAPLPTADRQALDLAIATQRLERSPVLDRLITSRGALLGSSSKAARFELLAPVGTTVTTDRPVFRWTPLDGATSYVVSVFDESFQKVAESAALPATDWQPPASLPRGRVLNWQVSAKRRGVNVQAPVPPAAEARFEVVTREVADQIEVMRRDHPGNPLLMAVLLARAGALDDALQALRGMDTGVAQHFKESIDRFRKP